MNDMIREYVRCVLGNRPFVHQIDRDGHSYVFSSISDDRLAFLVKALRTTENAFRDGITSDISKEEVVDRLKLIAYLLKVDGAGPDRRAYSVPNEMVKHAIEMHGLYPYCNVDLPGAYAACAEFLTIIQTARQTLAEGSDDPEFEQWRDGAAQAALLGVDFSTISGSNRESIRREDLLLRAIEDRRKADYISVRLMVETLSGDMSSEERASALVGLQRILCPGDFMKECRDLAEELEAIKATCAKKFKEADYDRS